MPTPTPQPPAHGRVGRPPIREPRGLRVSYRLTVVEYEGVVAAAAKLGQPIAHFLRDAALIAAGLAAPKVNYTERRRNRRIVGRFLRRLAERIENG